MSNENRKSVDFHVHYDPLHLRSGYEAIEIASRKGVVAIGLLARGEIVDEFNAFLEFGREKGVHIIPGIETLVKVGKKKVDLICLGFDFTHISIQQYFGQEKERERNRLIAGLEKQFLEDKGFSFEVLDDEENKLLKTLLSGETTEKAIRFCKIVVSNPANTDLIDSLKRKFNKKWQMVVSKYSEFPNYKGKPKRIEAKFLYLLYFNVGMSGHTFVDKEIGGLQRSAEEIIGAVHEAGGVVLYSPEGVFDPSIWQDLQGLDINGIMAWHASRLGMDRRGEDIPLSTIKEARKRGLLVLGGSDYQQEDWQIGEGNNREMFVGPRRLEELLDYIRKRNNGSLPWKR